MDIKVILLAILSCINADHLSTDLLPPHLPPANVANVFHESGITFVSPTSSNLEISSSVLALPIPLTHAFGFVSHNSNKPQELVRTHSFQPVTHGLHSSISALSSPNGIQSNIKGKITLHGHVDDDSSTHVSHDVQVNIQSPPTDVVHARFVENENHAVHEINSRTQHFEYKVPLIRTEVPPHPKHVVQTNQRKSIAEHSTYGVPSHIPSQDEINTLPVFQNDKFLSPIVRDTNTPTTHSSIEPPAQTIENIFDTSFHSNNPTAHTRVQTFKPLAQSRNNPTTHTREHFIDGNNRQYTNRFSLSDGTKVTEQGKLISSAGGWENVIVKTGEYEYISPEGIPVRVKWIADHEGYRVL